MRTNSTVGNEQLTLSNHADPQFFPTKAPAAKRSELSPEYHANRAIMLRKFAAALPGHSLCDLQQAHLDVFFGSLDKIPSKSRNRKPAASAKVRNHKDSATAAGGDSPRLGTVAQVLSRRPKANRSAQQLSGPVRDVLAAIDAGR
jgi:hypothetical protein